MINLAHQNTPLNNLDFSPVFSAVIILNGPSSRSWLGYPFSLPLYGTNLAYTDWPLDHCVIVDTEAIKSLRHHTRPSHTRFYTKTSCPDNLLWPGLERITIPGIDSGTAATQLALEHTQGQVLVIGADGQFGQTQTHYPYAWSRRPPTLRVYQIHRQTWLLLHLTGRVIFVHEQQDQTFITMQENTARTLV